MTSVDETGRPHVPPASPGSLGQGFGSAGWVLGTLSSVSATRLSLPPCPSPSAPASHVPPAHEILPKGLVDERSQEGFCPDFPFLVMGLEGLSNSRFEWRRNLARWQVPSAPGVPSPGFLCQTCRPCGLAPAEEAGSQLKTFAVHHGGRSVTPPCRHPRLGGVCTLENTPAPNRSRKTQKKHKTQSDQNNVRVIHSKKIAS